MIAPAFPADEAERLEYLQSLDILDTAPESEFDQLVQLASAICGTPIALVTLVDHDRQWFKARLGLDVSETSREVSFCGHTILQKDIMEIPDTHKDNRFHDNPLVTNDPNIRFYAGIPLTTQNGFNLGSLCVIDSKPRILTDEQKLYLKILGRQVVLQIELRQHLHLQTERLKKIEEQNREINSLLESKDKLLAELSESNQTKDKILSVISHDLRSPLSSLKTIVDLFEGGKMDEATTRQITAQVNKSIGFSIDLLDNLVRWSKKQLEGFQVIKTPFNLHNLVSGISERLETRFQSKGNMLINEVNPELIIHADEDLIRMVLRNLINNANKFTENGSIKVGVISAMSQWTVYVKDTGPGMSDDQVATLFSWNVTQNKSYDNVVESTGLGLIICRDFIKLHNGKIWAESKLGEGSTFLFSIPIAG
jgi:signal transduction histidine kinase